MRFLLGIMMLCIISSCNEKKTSFIDNFPLKVDLRNEICLVDSCIAPNNIVFMDNFLIYKEKGQDVLMRCLDLNTGKVKKFLRRGNGPDEVNNVIRLTSSDGILQVFTDPEEILFYYSDDLKNENIFPRKKQHLYVGQSAFASAFQIWPDLLFYSGKISETDTCRYCIYNVLNDSLYSFEEFPCSDSNIQSFPKYDMSRQLAYQGDFVFSTDKNKLFFFYFYGLGFDIIDTKMWKVVSQHIYQYPDVKINRISELNINKVSRNPESLCGFIDACATNQNVYALYTGKHFNEDYSSGKHVLQYNWKGEPQVHYVLDIEINSISVDEKNKILYATTNEENARIIKYKIGKNL